MKTSRIIQLVGATLGVVMAVPSVLLQNTHWWWSIPTWGIASGCALVLVGYAMEGAERRRGRQRPH